jgi:hypothetical protein
MLSYLQGLFSMLPGLGWLPVKVVFIKLAVDDKEAIWRLGMLQSAEQAVRSMLGN